MYTIKDVAKKAGVGVSTVSRYINRKGYVSKAASNKIEDAMETLNYYPNAAARSIKSKETKTVAFLLPTISNPFFFELANAIEGALYKKGYKVLLCSVDENKEKEEKYIDMILSNQIDGVISSTGFISQRLIDSNLPIVSTDRLNLKFKHVLTVTSNHFKGAEQATLHLIESGCKKLLHIHGSTDIEPALHRRQGFEQTCEKHGIPYVSISENRTFNAELIKAYDGVFVWNDVMAIKLLSFCLENHIRIPQDIQIVGFDNIALASMVYPPITTVGQSIDEIGQATSDMLLWLMKKEEVKPENLIIDTKLIKRLTTKGGHAMNIVVIGSINMDMITQAGHFPKTGETVMGNDFMILPGGKGANQAVSAARLGAKVHFIGCVGHDAHGDEAIKNLEHNHVNTSRIKKIAHVPTGIAQITVAEKDNSIIIVQGANAHVSIDIIKENSDVIDQADLVLMQLEIPLETVEYVLDYCAHKGIKTLLNPAPAKPLTDKMIAQATYLTPNHIECETIFKRCDDELLKAYPNKLIVSRGSQGVSYYDGETIQNIEAHRVDVVDTTGAGDALNGGIGIGIIQGLTLKEAVQFGNKAAAISVQKIGAQSSLPYKEDIQ